jgi:hypothetical protein
LSRTCPYTITSFSFFPGVSVEEKQMSVRTPFLQKLGPSFMADSSRFWGICGYFWPRRLNPTHTTCWGISPIYSEMIFNVKVVDSCTQKAILCNIFLIHQEYKGTFSQDSCMSTIGEVFLSSLNVILISLHYVSLFLIFKRRFNAEFIPDTLCSAFENLNVFL